MTTWKKDAFTKIFILSTLLLLALLMVCCGETPDDAGNSDGDSDADSDGDADGDSDGDSDAEGGSIIAVDEIDVNNWTEPSGIGSVLGPSVPAIGFEILEESDGEFTAFVGTLDGDSQDTCNPTAEMSGTIDEEGKFVLGPQDFTAIVKYYHEDNETTYIAEATIYDMTLSGTFNEDRTEFTGVRTTGLTGTMDIREIYSMFWGTYPDADADEICEKIYEMYYPTSCQACDSDGEEYCLGLVSWKVSGSSKDVELEDVSGVEDSCLEE